MALLFGAPPVRADEPLRDWLSGIGDAAQAQADGDFSRAAASARRALQARPHGPAAARASAALGLALAHTGASADAAEALELALAATSVPARPQLALARGEALLASGKPAEAARVLGEAASGEGTIAERARLREADALLETGLAIEAVPALENLLRGARNERAAAPARLALAGGYRRLGDAARAVEAYRALWLELPQLPEARSAGDALDAWRRAGGPVPVITGDDRVARAERLLAAGRPEEALAELDAAASADETSARPELATVLRSEALLALGRHADAERVAAPLADATAEDVRRTATWVLARCAARAGRVDEASRRYAQVAAERASIPGLPEWRQRDVGDEAAYVAAWLYYDAGRYTTAVERLDAFARTHRHSRRAEDALWFAAWSRYRLGRGDAARAFARLVPGPLSDAALYWQARLARAPARRRALYEAALRAGGDGWYGLLSRARLVGLGEAPSRGASAEPRPLPDGISDPAASGRLSVAVELLGLGLRDDALAELRDLARTTRVRPVASLVAQLAAFAGDAELPFRMARDHLLPTRRSVRWGHPDAFPELLPARAHAFGVDPALVLAVMRRESSFRREIRSGAGAEGLLQLRPATAARLAAVLGVPDRLALSERLADPEVSVGLGAHYLGLLSARFGDPALAVAAYNAGPRPAAEWARAGAGMPLDEWVECIPYRETRQYVKIVLADWDVYRGLSGEAQAPLDPARPVVAPADGVAF